MCSMLIAVPISALMTSAGILSGPDAFPLFCDLMMVSRSVFDGLLQLVDSSISLSCNLLCLFSQAGNMVPLCLFWRFSLLFCALFRRFCFGCCHPAHIQCILLSSLLIYVEIHSLYFVFFLIKISSHVFIKVSWSVATVSRCLCHHLRTALVAAETCWKDWTMSAHICFWAVPRCILWVRWFEWSTSWVRVLLSSIEDIDLKTRRRHAASVHHTTMFWNFGWYIYGRSGSPWCGLRTSTYTLRLWIFLWEKMLPSITSWFREHVCKAFTILIHQSQSMCNHVYLALNFCFLLSMWILRGSALHFVNRSISPSHYLHLCTVCSLQASLIS